MPETGKCARRRWPWLIAIAAVVAVIAIVSVGKHNRTEVSANLAAAVAGQETITVSTGDVHEFVSSTGHLMPIKTRVLSFDKSGKITVLNVGEGSKVASGSIMCELEASSPGLPYNSTPNSYTSPFGEWSETIQAGAADKQGASIRAPFAGVVASVNTDVGSYVAAGQPVITLIDTSSYIADIEIDEIDLSKVVPGMEATISFDAIPGVKLPGKVDSIAAMAIPKGGMVTIPVKVAIDGSHELLKPGITASVKILSHTLSNVVTIPVRSWIDYDGEPSAITIENGVPKLLTLELGLSNGECTHVISGLDPGDVIVADAVTVQERLRRASGQDRVLTVDVQRVDE